MESDGMQKIGETTHQTVRLPEPTGWPILLAMGLTPMVAAVVTNFGIGILGGILTVAGQHRLVSRCAAS